MVLLPPLRSAWRTLPRPCAVLDELPLGCTSCQMLQSTCMRPLSAARGLRQAFPALLTQVLGLASRVPYGSWHPFWLWHSLLTLGMPSTTESLSLKLDGGFPVPHYVEPVSRPTTVLGPRRRRCVPHLWGQETFTLFLAHHIPMSGNLLSHVEATTQHRILVTSGVGHDGIQSRPCEHAQCVSNERWSPPNRNRSKASPSSLYKWSFTYGSGPSWSSISIASAWATS